MFLDEGSCEAGPGGEVTSEMAARRVDGTGLKQEACRKATSSCLVCVAKALLATWWSSVGAVTVGSWVA
jgi:hypothetical protein